MAILVTGINGFLGQALAKSLVKNNHRVIGIGRQNNCQTAGIEYHQIDLSKPQDLSQFITRCKIIYHLAALTAHEDIVNNTLETEKISLLSTDNLLNPIINDPNPKIFIFPSSGKVYGNYDSLPIMESQKPDPINLLGKIKRKTENYIDTKANDKDSFLIFRIFNVYGPNQRENFVMPTIINQLIKKKSNAGSFKITLGDVEAKRDYIFIDDVIELLTKVSNSSLIPKRTTYINVGSGKAINVKKIISLISNIIKKEIIINIDKSRYRSDELQIEYSNVEKAYKLFNWRPKTSLKTGINAILKYYRLVF